MQQHDSFSRREFGRESLAAAASLGLAGASAAQEGADDAGRPAVTCGVSSGDVSTDRAVIWSRSNRPARMLVDLSTDPAFQSGVRTVDGPETSPHRDFTAKVEVRGLTPGTTWHYRVRFVDLDDPRVESEPVVGRLRTASPEPADVRFVWSADTAGQGYGIDVARGGMRTYATMLARDPDFLVHCGDHIYADNPIPATLRLDDGSEWRNIVTPETSKVAETLDEFRGNYRYNFLDEHFRAFHAAVPVVAVWDDHETLNNWYPGKQLDRDDRYQVKSASLLASRARTAFFEYLPIGETLTAPGRILRTISYGPLLELFCIDMRTFRGPNHGRGPDGREDWRLLGRWQVEWLKRRLQASTATWKVVCSDMPLGLVVTDGPDAIEAMADGHGPLARRELELADLLQSLRDNRVRNVIWIAGDVHYASSIHYDPQRAIFREFDPFWEFISGPLHAGTFGPGRLDPTFGPELKFQSIPQGMKANRPPSEGLQFFGEVRIDAATRTLTVSHFNVAGEKLWSIDLAPQGA